MDGFAAAPGLAGANFLVRRFEICAGLIPSFLAFRASRNFLIFVLATSLCLAQTIPKTGAAGFLQPGTGQSCRGAFLRVLPLLPTGEMFGGRPGRRRPRALSTAARAWARAWLSTSMASWLVKVSTSD